MTNSKNNQTTEENPLNCNFAEWIKRIEDQSEWNEQNMGHHSESLKNTTNPSKANTENPGENGGASAKKRIQTEASRKSPVDKKIPNGVSSRTRGRPRKNSEKVLNIDLKQEIADAGPYASSTPKTTRPDSSVGVGGSRKRKILDDIELPHFPGNSGLQNSAILSSAMLNSEIQNAETTNMHTSEMQNSKISISEIQNSEIHNSVILNGNDIQLTGCTDSRNFLISGDVSNNNGVIMDQNGGLNSIVVFNQEINTTQNDFPIHELQ